MLHVKELKEKEIDTIVSNVQGVIRDYTENKSDSSSELFYVLVYAAYVASTNDVDNVNDLLSHIETNISEQRAMFVKEVARKELDIVFPLTRKFSVDKLLTYLYVCPRDYTAKMTRELGTPDSISKLALKILGVGSGETVADFGSGIGDFLTLTAELHKDNPLYGIEINAYSSEISKIRAELFSDNTMIEQGNMFVLPTSRKFDKIFSNYPFNLRPNLMLGATEYINSLLERVPEIKRATSSDWIFNSLVLDHLTDDGKAVAIMTNGSAWSNIDRDIREYFVSNGFIEAVIALPSRLFNSTMIATTMIVISRGNKSVKMVDARELCESKRRTNLITDSNIDSIVKLLTEGGEKAITVNRKKLEDNDFVLNPFRYLAREEFTEIKDGVEFGSLMKRVTRGAPIMARELDEMTSNEPTNTQYLMLANIQNGMISENLPYLKELDSKLDKYCIGNRNLLLSKNGTPFKVAIAEIEKGRKLLGNGNLFIIELDEEKVNPYFLKAFFDSEVGTAALISIAAGVALLNISVESLRKLIVPLPPMEKQNEIANLYQAKIDEIKMLRLRIQKAQNELKGIFGEVE